MKNCWSLKLSKLVLLLVAVVCAPRVSFAQFSLSKEIPGSSLVNEEAYLFPVNPGMQNYLAGTMGELRNTHFHAGIDIRTNNEIGWPVLASKSGYISKAAVTPGGFGNVL